MGKILIDANVLIGLYRPDDYLHEKAIAVVSRLKSKKEKTVILNLVIHEIVTVLSMRVGMELAKKFVKEYQLIIDEVICLDEKLEKVTWEIFLRQQKKGTSFVDCANIAAIELYKLDGILTFDEFYPKAVRLG